MRSTISKFFPSIRYKMLAAYIPAIVVPILLVGILARGIAARVVTARAESANTLIVTQLRGHLETIIEDVSSTSMLIILDRDLGRLMNTPNRQRADYNVIQRNLQEFLSHLRTSRAYVYALHLEFFDGQVLQTSNPTHKASFISLGLSDGEKAEMFRENGAAVWRLLELDQQGHFAIRYTRMVKDIADQVTPIAYLSIYVDTEYLSTMLREASLLTGSTLSIVDTEGQRILACSRPDLIGARIEALRNLVGSRESFIRSDQELRSVNWQVISDVPMSVVVADSRRIDYVTLLGAFLGLAVGLLATILLSKRILLPLEELRNQMNAFSTGETGVQVDIRSSDEIALVGKTFNEMSRRLKEMTLKVFTAQIEKRDAEIAALNAQINPHFLFNTLDTIYWIAKQERAGEAARLTKALSALFRLSLSSGDGLCLLSDELSHLRNYIIIQEKRYQKLRFLTEVDESLLGFRVAKLILQPLVENSIVHGLESSAFEGLVRIQIKTDQDALLLVVEDDGQGADECAVAELIAQGTGKNGFALRNIDRRVKLLGGEGFGLEFRSTPGRGAKVTVRHPILPEAELGSHETI